MAAFCGGAGKGASIRAGGALMERAKELSVPDDRTIVFRLKRPFPVLTAVLGEVSPCRSSRSRFSPPA